MHSSLVLVDDGQSFLTPADERASEAQAWAAEVRAWLPSVVWAVDEAGVRRGDRGAVLRAGMEQIRASLSMRIAEAEPPCGDLVAHWGQVAARAMSRLPEDPLAVARFLDVWVSVLVGAFIEGEAGRHLAPAGGWDGDLRDLR
jgi:hypothetical protein